MQPTSGHPINSKDDLPAAVDYEDRHALLNLDDLHLVKLVGECEYWTSWMTRFRSGLSTPAGQTEWSVLMKQETETVKAAFGRVRDELEARRRTVFIASSDDDLSENDQVPTPS